MEYMQESDGFRAELLVKVFADNYKLLFRIIHSRTRCVEDSQDILQETFIKAYKYYRTKIPEDRILPWLVAIAKHTAITYRKGLPAVEPIEPYLDFLGDAAQTDAMDEIHIDAFNECFFSIPADLQIVLKRHILDEVPLKRLARLYHVPFGRLRYWRAVFYRSAAELMKR
jgi:RNA polymerase sigma factor (sigma-70 family)